MGKRVGVKYHSPISQLLKNGLTSTRWLYSTCMKCPTCKVNYPNCPNQSNSGRVSFLPHCKQSLADLSRMSLERSSVCHP